MPLVYFVRHGQTPWNAEKRLQGQSDIDLNEVGRLQADHNGETLKRLVGSSESFDFVASPMRRACETMARIRAKMGRDPDGFRTDPRLLEVHFGDWQGYTYEELEAVSPQFRATRESDKWNVLPPGKGAESYAMLENRVLPWFREIDHDTICVAHGGVGRVLLKVLGGLSEAEAAYLEVSQDKVLRISGGSPEWL